MEGTGLLQNGMMVNLGMTKNKFEKVNRKADPFGIGSNENPVQCFSRKKTTTLY
jgi:hypothetical protein